MKKIVSALLVITLFSGICGTSLAASGTIYCWNCGKKIAADSNYCSYCAAKQNTVSASGSSGSGSSYSTSIPTWKVGDIIRFGSYEQDNNRSNGKEDIEWRVLDVQGGKALLISKYALDSQAYNTNYANVTWETCSLRKWLNGTFLNNAFSAEEQKKIVTTKVTADKNPKENADSGKAVEDKVFLLNVSEAEKYFANDEDRMCAPTAYAEAQGADLAYYSYSNKTEDIVTSCWWWLRSSGGASDGAPVVYCGSIDHDMVYYSCICVRPAIWVNLDK